MNSPNFKTKIKKHEYCSSAPEPHRLINEKVDTIFEHPVKRSYLGHKFFVKNPVKSWNNPVLTGY